MVTGPVSADRALHVLRPPEPGPPPRPQDPEHLPDAVPGPRQDRGLRHLQDPVHQEQGLHRGGHPLLHITGAVRRLVAWGQTDYNIVHDIQYGQAQKTLVISFWYTYSNYSETTDI